MSYDLESPRNYNPFIIRFTINEGIHLYIAIFVGKIAPVYLLIPIDTLESVGVSPVL